MNLRADLGQGGIGEFHEITCAKPGPHYYLQEFVGLFHGKDLLSSRLAAVSVLTFILDTPCTGKSTIFSGSSAKPLKVSYNGIEQEKIVF